ncbi:MAG: hypothetical protein KatS3mg095_0746 [Candidatus Parcubacteria bacterium]|nr:MAG: hypothetical protein KatS3mg095_0746 [Candidatus Parcubacteria bacterium]
MSEERDYIYLKGIEELGEVIDALRDIRAKEIIIVVPRNTKCFLNSTNLSILRDEINKLKKKIYIDSDDEKIISLARAHSLDIFLSDYGVDEVTQIVTDILPPQKSKPKITRKMIEKKDDVNDYQSNYSSTTKKGSKKTKIVYYLSFVFIIVVAYFVLINYFSSYTLNIILKTEKHPVEENIILSANISKADLDNLIFPAEYIEITKNHSIRQKTTGVKAGTDSLRGRVKFINKDQENSISLIPGTRIQTDTGNIYRTMERVNLQPGSEEEVVVFSEKNDPKYYLSDLDTKFTIPGLKGTRWEDKIEVKLLEPIIAEKEIHFVSLDDINNAKLNLEKQIKEIIKQELKLKYSNYIFPEELGVFDFNVVNISHNIGQQTDEIIITGTGNLKTIGIKENNLREYLKDIVSKQNLRKDLNFNIINLKIDSITMNDFNLKSKELIAYLRGEIEIKGDIDSKKLIAEIAGQNVDEIKDHIRKYESIERAELLIFPPWLNKLPLDISKINVKIK